MSQWPAGMFFDPSESWARGFGMALQQRQLQAHVADQELARQQAAAEFNAQQDHWTAEDALRREQLAQSNRLAGIDDSRQAADQDLRNREFQFRQNQAAAALARQAEADAQDQADRHAWGQFIVGAGLPQDQAGMLAQMDPAQARMLAAPMLADAARQKRLTDTLQGIENDYGSHVQNVHSFFNDLLFSGQITPEQYDLNVSRNLQNHRDWRAKAIAQAHAGHQLDATPGVPFDVPSALNMNDAKGTAAAARGELATRQEDRRDKAMVIGAYKTAIEDLHEQRRRELASLSKDADDKEKKLIRDSYGSKINRLTHRMMMLATGAADAGPDDDKLLNELFNDAQLPAQTSVETPAPAGSTADHKATAKDFLKLMAPKWNPRQ